MKSKIIDVVYVIGLSIIVWTATGTILFVVGTIVYDAFIKGYWYVGVLLIAWFVLIYYKTIDLYLKEIDDTK